MARDPIYSEFAYLTFDDIKMLSYDSNETLIAVKAPIGSKIEIPDPEQLEELYLQYGEPAELIKKYQVFVTSQKNKGDVENGEIHAFIIDSNWPYEGDDQLGLK